MAQLVTVRLARHDSTPWGFRLQGGKDFGTPLLIQKVNGGSLAEQAGLAVGDGLIKVNGQDVFDLRHKDAQDAIVHGGNSLELQVQRGGGSTWKPLVTSIGSTPSPLPHVSGPPPCVTKTSLAANKYPGKTPLIGSGHNIAPKPFNGLPHSQLNGNANGSVKAIVNKQYNTPVGIYSEETIAETLSAQAEVLAGGVLGVNFKKNEKHYNAQNSEVLKMVQEADAEPRSPEPVQPSSVAYFATSSHAVGGRATSPRPLTPMAQQIAHNSPGSPYVVAKETNVAPTSTVDEPPNCSECGKIVVGVFVRIKDKNLHVECFKCATCGTSLKNVGYYNINNKLYCDIHAKMIARQNPPAPNLEPVTVSPGGRIPSNVVSNAINSAMSPKSNSVSSPFQTPSSNILSPKSFNGTSAPLTPPISSNFSPRPQTVGENKSSNKINSSSWQTSSSGNGLCPSPLPSVPGFVLSTSKSSSPGPQSPTLQRVNQNPIFASLPSVSQSIPGTNCISPAPLPSVPGYVSPSPKTQRVNQNPIFANLPSVSQAVPGTNCISPAPLPSVPGYISPIPRTYASSSVSATSVSSATARSSFSTSQLQSLASSAVKVSESRYSQEGCCQQKTADECYGTPCSVKQLKPIPQSKSPCMWSGSSHEVSHTNVGAAKSLSSTLETQLMIKTIKETGRWSPVPPVDPSLSRQFPTNLAFTNFETDEPSGYNPPVLSKANNLPPFMFKPCGPPPVISFPPEFDPTPLVLEYSRSRSTTPLPTREIETRTDISASAVKNALNDFVEGKQVEQKILPTVSHEQKSEVKPLAVEPPCQKKYVAEVRSLVREAPKTEFDTSFLSHQEVQPPGVLPISMANPPIETSADGFNSVSLPPESKPYYPNSMLEQPEPKIFRPEPPVSGSPLLFALTTAPDRSYSPLPSVTKGPTPPPVDSWPDFNTELPVIPGVRPVSMLAALTVASERPYSPMPYYPPAHSVSAKTKEAQPDGSAVEKKVSTELEIKKSKSSHKGIEITVTSEDDTSYELEKYASQNPDLKGKQCVKIPRQNSPSRLSYTNSGLHKPSTIPPYQQNLGDGTYTPRSRSPQPPSSSKDPEKIPTHSQESIERKANTNNVCTRNPCSNVDVKPLKSCVMQASGGTNVENKKAGQTCCKKVTIADKAQSASLTESSSCQRSVCERSVCESSVCAKPYSDTKQSLVKSCPYFTSDAGCTKGSKISSEIVEAKAKSQNETKQVCSLSSSKTCTKTVKISESFSSTVSSSTVVSSSSSSVQAQSPAITVTNSSGLESDSLSKKAESSISVGGTTCVNKKQVSSMGAEQTDSIQGSSSKPSSGASSCPLKPNSQVVSGEKSQSKPLPMAATNSPLSATHRLSPLVVSDIHTDSNQTSTFCKTASGSQIFKPQVPPQSQLSKPSNPSSGTKSSVPAALTKSTEIKSVSLTESVANKPIPTLTATAPSTPTTVSQSANSAFSSPKRTQGSVASSLSKTLTARIAATNSINSSNQPASFPNTESASNPNSGAGGATKGGTAAGLTVPRRGRGVLNPQNLTPGARVPLCGQCHEHIRGPFITALGKIWCPDHFICVNKDCRRPLQDIGFVEESSGLYCEYCFEQFLAPTCHKCSNKIKGDCLNAIGKHFHPECFKCAFCSKLFGNNPFFLEEGLPYCENDWNELFTTKCFACGFPIEAGDRWVEALNNNYHSPCFNCTMCKKNLEGESFYAKGGRPYCKSHAR